MINSDQKWRDLKVFKRILAGLMTVLMLITATPAAAAASEESVLTSIGHSDTDTVALSGSERYVTLTVPFDYEKPPLTLSTGWILPMTIPCINR
jgi:hypothetical protein